MEEVGWVQAIARQNSSEPILVQQVQVQRWELIEKTLMPLNDGRVTHVAKS